MLLSRCSADYAHHLDGVSRQDSLGRCVARKSNIFSARERGLHGSLEYSSTAIKLTSRNIGIRQVSFVCHLANVLGPEPRHSQLVRTKQDHHGVFTITPSCLNPLPGPMDFTSAPVCFNSIPTIVAPVASTFVDSIFATRPGGHIYFKNSI
ncbi:hypothetical protein BD779DRAFT_411212 [Infundibulicybe gibba]|nr:hypothetical protein BD779DRAFT_411212 [Infundibulicybe gibba]